MQNGNEQDVANSEELVAAKEAIAVAGAVFKT